MLIRQHKQPTIRATYQTHKKWPGSKEVNKLQLHCDFEDSGFPNSSSLSRKIHHSWRPLSLPQYHRVVKKVLKIQQLWLHSQVVSNRWISPGQGAKAFQPPTCQFFHLGDYWRGNWDLLNCCRWKKSQIGMHKTRKQWDTLRIKCCRISAINRYIYIWLWRGVCCGNANSLYSRCKQKLKVD